VVLPEAVPPATPMRKGSERWLRLPLRRAGLSRELTARSSARLRIMPSVLCMAAGLRAVAAAGLCRRAGNK
jgi:hypothetical protein